MKKCPDRPDTIALTPPWPTPEMEKKLRAKAEELFIKHHDRFLQVLDDIRTGRIEQYPEWDKAEWMRKIELAKREDESRRRKGLRQTAGPKKQKSGNAGNRN